MTRLGAVTFDAMGTLVAIEPPAPRLQQSLERRLGLAVDLARCEGAMRVEMRHYRAHCTAARDAPSLAALRLECASLLADALALEVWRGRAPALAHRRHLFHAYPDAQPALERLAAAGLKLAVVANWDISLHDVLARLGLAAPLDAIVTAAAVGAAKPDPGRFASHWSASASRPRVRARRRRSRDGRGRRAGRRASARAARPQRSRADSLPDLAELAARLGVPA